MARFDQSLIKKKIKMLLVMNDMSITDLAAKIGSSKQVFYNKMNDDNANFSIDLLYSISSAFGIPISDFLEDTHSDTLSESVASYMTKPNLSGTTLESIQKLFNSYKEISNRQKKLLNDQDHVVSKLEEEFQFLKKKDV
jgi:transcriptional regulator with XRE-family HTH domain